MTTKAKKLQARLGKPIRLPPPPSELKQITDPTALKKWRGDCLVDHMIGDMEAWTALFAHYGIERPTGAAAIPHLGGDPWKAIAVALARDFVPGFGVVYESKIKRRNTAWTPGRQMKLVFAVEDYLEAKALGAPGRNAAEACRKLARKADWLDGVVLAKSLYQRYMEAQNSPLAVLWEIAKNRIESADTLAEFRTIMERIIATEHDRVWPRDISTGKPV